MKTAPKLLWDFYYNLHFLAGQDPPKNIALVLVSEKKSAPPEQHGISM
jgi:hypothetical protein